MIPEQHRRKAAATAVAMALAAPAEGIRQYAYYDPPHVLTVCRGHTGPDVIKGKKYSLAECEALFNIDMAIAIDAVDRCVPGLPVKVLGAWGDTVYNLGPRVACDTKYSTAARLLRARDLAGACRQLPRWNKATVGGFLVPLPGLTTRRANAEITCLEGVGESA